MAPEHTMGIGGVRCVGAKLIAAPLYLYRTGLLTAESVGILVRWSDALGH